MFSKVKVILGLDQAKACFTTAAPIAIEVSIYYPKKEIHIYIHTIQKACRLRVLFGVISGICAKRFSCMG